MKGRIYTTYFPFSLIVCLVYGIFTTYFSYGQSSPFSYRNFTTLNGLPSNECYEVIQDRDGFIWISTDNGVVRFDGIHFKRYGPQEGLKEEVVFKMILDEQGKIWVIGLRSEIYIYYPTEDTFKPYQFNTILRQNHILEAKSYVDQFNVYDDEVTIALPYHGKICIDKDGREIMTDWRKNGKIFYESDNKHMVIGYYGSEITDTFEFYLHSGCKVHHVYSVALDDSKNATIKGYDYSGVKALYGVGYLWVFEEGCVSIKDTFDLGEFSENSDGRPVFCLLNKKGVRIYKNLIRNEYEHIFEGISATSFLEDNEGGYWVTSLNNGLFYIPNPNIKILHNTHNTAYTDIVSGRHEMYVASKNGEIVAVKPDKMATIHNYKEDQLHMIMYDTLNNKLLYAHGVDSYWYKNNAHGDETQYLPIQTLLGKAGVHVGDTTYLVSQNGNINLIDKNGIFLREVLDKSLGVRPLSLENVGDKLYLGTLEGLYTKNIHTRDGFVEDKNLKGIRIEDIIYIGNETLALATKGYGLVIYQVGTEPTFISTDVGLVDNYIEDIHLAKDGSIWVSTFSGISKVSTDYKISNITTSHGLPTNEVYQITEYNGKIYAATGKGIVHLPMQLAPPSIQNANIMGVRVNGEYIDIDKVVELSHDQNTLVFDVLSLNYAHANNIKYRYRLNAIEWIETENRDILLSNLTPGQQVLEIQTQNKNGEWGPSVCTEINISYPWYSQWWFYLLSICTVLMTIYYIYKSRTHQIKVQYEIEQEIQELEKAALQAQMSPHFIFNCLNSIQNFIFNNEKEMAMEYLGRFANLIRQFLLTSKSNLISLDTEIDMLNNYLLLESIRFHNVFKYAINMPPSADLAAIKIPPMLIQPFVENAIIHGMKGKKDNQGIISVKVNVTPEVVIIDIKDNGPGISSIHSRPTGHRSLGVQITKKRLDIIRKTAGKTHNYEVISSDKGTHIHLVIPYE